MVDSFSGTGDGAGRVGAGGGADERRFPTAAASMDGARNVPLSFIPQANSGNPPTLQPLAGGTGPTGPTDPTDPTGPGRVRGLPPGAPRLPGGKAVSAGVSGRLFPLGGNGGRRVSPGFKRVPVNAAPCEQSR